MLDERKAAILAALVEDHIASGTPVSSRAVLERSGLSCSTATIRNEFVVLEQEGLIAKPHTSAGRIPTDRGYRYYVDHLSPTTLLDMTQTKIDSFFATVRSEVARILRETTELLSEITHYPAVVLGPGLKGQVITDARLLGLEPGVVMLVLVTEGGGVHQAMLRLPVPVTPVELERSQSMVQEALVDSVLTDDPTVPSDADGPEAIAGLLGLVADAVADATEAGREVYVGGTSRMVDLWEDLAKLHRVLGLLEREAALADLLGEGEDSIVRIGPETGTGEVDLAVVAASYGGGAGAGRMGVLGPMRMDYGRTIRVIEEVSEALGESLES